MKTERLTRKLEDKDYECIAPNPYYALPYIYKEEHKALNKLGQLEDIEEELEIDLITLFKALRNGIYYKFYLRLHAEPLEKIDVRLGKDDENNWCLITWCWSSGFCSDEDVYIYFTDYGKTWALTRKELEK